MGNGMGLIHKKSGVSRKKCSWAHLPGPTHDITFEECKKMKSASNSLDKDVIIKNAHGFSGSVLENADEVPRLPNSGSK